MYLQGVVDNGSPQCPVFCSSLENVFLLSLLIAILPTNYTFSFCVAFVHLLSSIDPLSIKLSKRSFIVVCSRNYNNLHIRSLLFLSIIRNLRLCTDDQWMMFKALLHCKGRISFGRRIFSRLCRYFCVIWNSREV